MNNYEFTNVNRNQSDLEVELTHILCLSGEGDILDDLAFAEWAKECEEEWESIPAKGTRHPSTRAKRRKKTAHAKERRNNTIRVREARKYPYSLMLGKGKRHNHHWLDEDAIISLRAESKEKSERADYLLETENVFWEEAEEDYYDDLFPDQYEWNLIHSLREEVAEKEDYIAFLERQINSLLAQRVVAR